MYDRILVPSDGSDHALRAMEHAQRLSNAFDAAVYVLNVVDLDAAGGPFNMGGLDEEFIERLKERGHDEIHSSVAKLGEGIDVHTDVITGTPSNAILEYADENAIDLLVMGTHGRSGLKRYVLGSVAESVVRRSEPPVITVRATDQRQAPTGYDDILVPTDGSTHAGLAAEHGIEIAQRFDARIHAVHIVDIRVLSGTPDAAVPASFFEELTAHGEEVTEAVAERARAAGLDVTTTVQKGMPSTALVSYVQEQDIDLVTMGSAGRTGLDRYLMGSTTNRIIRHSEAPVLSISAKNNQADS
jgi:nucleotide-binding universal stress UspA family protein